MRISPTSRIMRTTGRIESRSERSSRRVLTGATRISSRVSGVVHLRISAALGDTGSFCRLSRIRTRNTGNTIQITSREMTRGIPKTLNSTKGERSLNATAVRTALCASYERLFRNGMSLFYGVFYPVFAAVMADTQNVNRLAVLQDRVNDHVFFARGIRARVA